jgi:hypothetical protein
MPTVGKRTTIKDTVYTILKRSGQPMTVSEITLIAQQMVSINSLTPSKTVNNALQKNKKVKRVSRATFKAIQ